MDIDYRKRIIGEIELHSVDGIRECFANGLSPNDTYNGEALISALIGEYTRTPRFKQCIRVFVDYGLVFNDSALLAVLLDDASKLKKELQLRPQILSESYTLPCAYTPLLKVSLLHICAEFNLPACASVLLDAGADVDAAAGFDDHGFGGQSPIFHTVNQNSNNSAQVMQLLLERKADLRRTVPGLVWGSGREWETFIPSVNPISYAMMGLLPQMHRDEKTIAGIVSLLVRHAYGIEYFPANVPCEYLKK